MNAAVDRDFSIIMDHFCNHWQGYSGELNGCWVGAVPGNLESWNVFATVGPGARPSDIESTMRMMRVQDMPACWDKIRILDEEFGRK